MHIIFAAGHFVFVGMVESHDQKYVSGFQETANLLQTS